MKDPNSSLTPDEVLEFYSAKEPKLITARVEPPKFNEKKNVYEFEFKSEFKSKG